MISRKSYTIVWDRIALNHFKEILYYLSKQSAQAPLIVREGILSRLAKLKKDPLIFEIDKLKDSPNDEFRAFVIYNYRITYQIKAETNMIRILRIRHVSREPFGY
jgi:plasmid stabilization system protein ParE